MIRFIDQPPRLSLLEFLYFAGDDRFGALGVSTSADEYLPRRLGPLPTLADAEQIHELVRKVLANEPVPQAQKRLISPGVTLGGARPKALLDIDGEQWVIKFCGRRTDRYAADRTRFDDARAQGKDSRRDHPAGAPDHGHAVAIKRFDRQRGQRVHSLSAQRRLAGRGRAVRLPGTGAAAAPSRRDAMTG